MCFGIDGIVCIFKKGKKSEVEILVNDFIYFRIVGFLEFGSRIWMN